MIKMFEKLLESPEKMEKIMEIGDQMLEIMIPQEQKEKVEGICNDIGKLDCEALMLLHSRLKKIMNKSFDEKLKEITKTIEK